MSSPQTVPTLGSPYEKEISRIRSTEDTSPPTENVEKRAQRQPGGPFASSRMAAYLRRFEQQLVEYNLEARGIERVQEHERMSKLTWVSYLQAFLLWVSINLAANNITLGMLGPATYGLSFLDSALCGVFGALVGAIVSSWMATWGPISGIRTMVCFHTLSLERTLAKHYNLRHSDAIQWVGGPANSSSS